jgi:phosphoglycerate kinase
MTKEFKTINDLGTKDGERVLLRVDFNVPTDESGNITNFFRINETLPTILDLQKQGAKVIIIAHKEEGSLDKVAEYLKTKIDNFSFNSEENKQVHLLENIRIDKREKSKDVSEREELGKELSLLGDYYINEAFSASHRDHASITSIPKFYNPEKKCLGPKFLEEIEKLSLALTPVHPMLLLVGGAKFDTKLALLEKFLNTADKIFVGGALAHTFWKNKNYELGQSLVDEEVDLSEKVLQAEQEGKIFLPNDIMLENRETKKPNELSTEERVVDFGQGTLDNILEIAKNSETIVWNGPVDFYEKGFDWGTKELIENLEKIILENPEKKIILGGGDTVTEIEKVRDERRKNDPSFNFHFTHVSTGGGAMIDFLSNGTLPGIEAIK